MPRIRSIKPDYFTHPEVLELSIPSRYLFVSLWTQADDEGRLYDQPAKIRGNAFSDKDRVIIGRLLADLATRGRILRYSADGRDCIQVAHFLRHQRVNRPTPSTIPQCPFYDYSLDPSPMPPGGLTEDSLPEGNGREVEGNGRDKPFASKTPYTADFEKFWAVYPSRKDKGHAATAFDAALKRASLEDIIAGAERYRDDPTRDPDKTKYAQGWLTGDRWLDESGKAAPRKDPDPDWYVPVVPTAEEMDAFAAASATAPWSKRGQVG